MCRSRRKKKVKSIGLNLKARRKEKMEMWEVKDNINGTIRSTGTKR